MLVRRLPKAVAAGEIAERLGVPPSTLSAHLAALAAILLASAGNLAAHHELADPADIFDKMDRPLVTATSLQALLAALGIFLIPIIIITTPNTTRIKATTYGYIEHSEFILSKQMNQNT